MYVDRNQKGLNPAGATAALAVSAAMFAAMVNMTPDFIKIVDPPLHTYPVDADPPPPPPPPPPPTHEVKKPVDSARPLPDPFTPKPLIDTLPPTNPMGTVDPPPIPEPYVPPSTGTGSGIIDPPTPLPVMTGVEVDPRYANDFQPEYPPDMRRAESEGTVVVRVLVGTNGRVKAVELIRSPSDSFFNVTKRQALSRWRFKPATQDGVPVEKWKVMTLQFRLTDA